MGRGVDLSPWLSSAVSCPCDGAPVPALRVAGPLLRGKILFAKARAFWHQWRSFMRLLKYLWRALRLGLLLKIMCGAAVAREATQSDQIVAHYHFAGCRQLAGNPDFANLKKVFAAPSSKAFVDLALDQLSASIGESLGFRNYLEADPLTRPLLDDLVACESVADFGGRASAPPGFLFAIHLDDARAALWQANIGKEFGTPGAKFQAEGAEGLRWSRGTNAFWLLRAHGWTLAGNSGNLDRPRNQYLQRLNQNGRPDSELKESWLEAEIDWPGLSHWLPDFSQPFKPARTKITLAMRRDNVRMKAQVTYPEEIAWHGQPWRIPTNLVYDPLISFTAGNDIAAFLKPIPQIERLTGNPLTNQFVLWALGEMPFQTYMAWPVENASNTLKTLSTEAPATLNPELQSLNASHIIWNAREQQLVWTGMPMIGPHLRTAPNAKDRYLLAGLFPLTNEKDPAPQALYQQFHGRADLVYYDWELSGARLKQWELLSQLLPLLPPGKPLNPTFVKSISTGRTRQLPTTIEENWLRDLAPMLGVAETVTEISRTAPNQLTLLRRSPIGLTSLEVVLLSHRLVGTGSGPIDMRLLPPRAKVTGPGAGH